ncbi:type II secretion system F family protein [Caulobacter sp. 17J80-11]|uniref:type II secretion system F family protein n=1 Tax=Caulobacter sp. 17J80-11 TaxID=2763502 RepID=UPI001653AED6|nr:type II secretion system F family protein [Caulobacter sp. 17J80-11]MBC6982416.1 type II secretion system F family protein [Caulobacter sp. 17J80-11]
MGAVTYLVYAAVFIAVVLTVEGVWLAVRGLSGENRDVNRRLALARKSGDEQAGLKLIARSQGGRVAAALDARLPWLRQALWAARAPISSAQFGLIVLGGFTGLFLLLTSSGWRPVFAVLMAAGAAGLGPLAALSFMAARRRARFLEQMPQAVDLIARSLQAGHPVPSALAVVAKQMPDPIGTEFGLVIDEMTYGLDRDEALGNLLQRAPSPELRMFVASLQVTRETGGNLAEVFLKLSEVVREKAQLRRKVHAITAEGRLSFYIITALPAVVVGGILVMRPAYYVEVASDPLFLPLMSGPPILLVIGALTIWRMVNFKI